MKISSPKTESFQIKKKKTVIFHISAQNIDCGYSLEPPRRGGSNEYPQSMFLNRNKKNDVYPCKPQFYYIKVGFNGVKIIWVCFRDVGNATIMKHNLHEAPKEGEKKNKQRRNKRHIFITKTILHVYSFDSLKPQFYTVKLGFTGVYISFLTSAQT